ncbi:ABC transporter permease subunit [Escherichia coli]
MAISALAAAGVSASAGDGLCLRRIYGASDRRLKIPAFIITLAGMFFLRGVSYLVSEESIPINHPIYDTLSSLAWKIPGGGRLSAMGLLMLAVVVIGIFLAHRTVSGNQVYAIGGNATSANLMGILPQHHYSHLYALHRTGNAGGDCLLDLYPGRICAGGRRCGTGCYRLSGNWRYALSGGVGTVLGTLLAWRFRG